MPRVSSFFGIIIAMYFNDHAPPHFHAVYQGQEAQISIESLEILRRSLPRRALALVLEWAVLHRTSFGKTGRRRGSACRSIPSSRWSRKMVRVRSVVPLEDFKVRLGFTDDTERVIDLTPYLKGPVFEPLKQDRHVFRSVRVDDELGTIVSPNGADICPDVLYESLAPAAWEETASRR